MSYNEKVLGVVLTSQALRERVRAKWGDVETKPY